MNPQWTKDKWPTGHIGEDLMPVIWGHVQAITIGVETRPRILVTACAPGPQETIDAQVSRNTLITRGIQIVSLSNIKCGEFIELTYINIGDRAEACAVYLRAQESFI